MGWEKGALPALPKSVHRKIWRAIMEFGLLAPGDRILVGFSGGKDSSLLLYALALGRQQAPFPFEVGAVTVDLGFAEPFNTARLKEFCDKIEVPYRVLPTRIAELAMAPGADSCAVCAFFRRGAMNGYAVEQGYNKVALAHHLDDVIETFLMGQLYSGQLKTFQPKTFLDRTGITVIRPLVYLREKEIRGVARRLAIETAASPCPLDGKTKRQEIKELLREMVKVNPFVYSNLGAALREGSHVGLWPRKMTFREMHQINEEFWGCKG